MRSLTAKKYSAIRQTVLGFMTGDAIGLKYEGMAPRYIASVDSGILGKSSMVSDDSEHALMALAAALRSDDNILRFEAQLRADLCRWVLALPPSLGWATARSCFLIGLGRKRGVSSQGNGPLMRVPSIAATVEIAELASYVEVSTRLTHDDDVSVAAALAYATLFNPGSPTERLAWAIETCKNTDVRSRLTSCIIVPGTTFGGWASVNLKRPHRGISGWILETLASVIVAWTFYPDDYYKAVEAIVRLGGDTDTAAALVGALLAFHGATIPPRCSDSISDIYDKRRLEIVLNGGAALPPFPLRLVRNIVQLSISILHILLIRPLIILKVVLQRFGG